ncbi:MAG: hypothetical protein HYR98_05895, partial [Nitrospirae bacterium]|nr:hypothetical protein [Nitrospirota bacterium]
MSFYVVRIVFLFVTGAIGGVIALKTMSAFAWTGVLVGVGVGFGAVALELILRRAPVRSLVGVSLGLVAGLLLAHVVTSSLALLPFEEGQIDTKHIEDFQALGSAVFRLRKFHLPLYQWTYVDAKTKVRFLAYSDTLGQGLGRLFTGLVMLWLRSCELHNPFHMRGDNGAEWCGGSKATEEEFDCLLACTGASFHSIPAGKKYLQGLAERSHRTDDEA